MRLPDWENRLSAFITERFDMPFEWGQNDCILFAMSAVEAMTGEDKGAAYRGRYSDKEGAALALREIGKGTLLKTVDSQFDRRPAGTARRGDLVMTATGSVGVCLGGVAAFVGEERLADLIDTPLRTGIVTLPRSAFKYGWTV